MSQNEAIVYVVDDDFSLRESLRVLILSAGWQPETFDSAQKFLSRPSVHVPSCLVLDLNLPGLNGLELQRQLAAEREDMPIIFITSYADIATTVRAMKAGAVEFLTKPVNDTALLSAIDRALDRSTSALLRCEETRRLRGCYGLLSRREREVMALVVRGLRNKEIGFKLGISEITVKAHRGRVMHKMCAQSLADLVRMNVKLDLPSVEPIEHSTHERTVN
jgi:FixJ family two-component response regulator